MSTLIIFKGASAPGNLSVPGLFAGDRVENIVDITAGVPIATNSGDFLPVAPGDGNLVQTTSTDLSGHTFLVLLAQ